MSRESCIEFAKQYTCPMTMMLDTPKKCIADECVKWIYCREIPPYHEPFKSRFQPGIFLPGRKESWYCSLGS